MTISIHHPTDHPNFSRVDVGTLTVWFSYRTPIALRHPKVGTVVRTNDWGPTTGKHLNEVDGGNKAARVDGNRFQSILSDLVPA